MSQRIDRLRTRMLDCEHKRYRIRKSLSILTEETEKLPVVRRKGLGFIRMLEESSCCILDDELIVGSRTLFSPRKSEEGEGLSKNLDFEPDAETLDVEAPGLEFYPHYLTDQEKKVGADLGVGEGYVTSHCSAGFTRVLEIGFGGLRDEAKRSLATYEADMDKVAFLQSVVDILDGVERYIGRYAEEALRLAETCSDPARRQELITLSMVCDWVKCEVPTTFHEALQLVWFTQIFVLMESYNLMSLGRPDQYLYPFYTADIDAGRLSQEEAKELLSCFFIKLNDTSDLHTDNGLNIVLSGLRPDGKDGTNELSYLFLEVYEAVKLTDPQINIRWHAETPKEFMRRAMLLTGKNAIPPMIFNDEVLVPALTQAGVELEDARDYAIDACQDVHIQNKSDFYPIFAGTYGIHLLTIFQRMLPRLPECSSFEEFYQLLKTEITEDVAEVVTRTNEVDAVLPQLSPTPVLSMTLEGCIERGLDKTAGGTRYNHTGFIGGGLVNIVDSLAAIKKWVFEEQRYTPQELLEALKANYEGFETLRAVLRNQTSAWGNGDREVDWFGQDLSAHFATEVVKYSNARDGRYLPGLMTHHQVRLGKVVGATPDGRRQGEPLAISLSPSLGRMDKGPTCALVSALAIDHRAFPVGTSVDLTLQSSFFRSEEDLAKVISMTETFLEGGGQEIQYNVLDASLLRAAQAAPDDYRDLVVRVWGFNAYFVTLQKEYQEELILRTETGAS